MIDGDWNIKIGIAANGGYGGDMNIGDMVVI